MKMTGRNKIHRLNSMIATNVNPWLLFLRGMGSY